MLTIVERPLHCSLVFCRAISGNFLYYFMDMRFERWEAAERLSKENCKSELKYDVAFVDRSFDVSQHITEPCMIQSFEHC